MTKRVQGTTTITLASPMDDVEVGTVVEIGGGGFFVVTEINRSQYTMRGLRWWERVLVRLARAWYAVREAGWRVRHFFGA